MEVLGVVDYIIFGLMLLISAGIGVYFRFAGGQQKTTEEFLLAGQDMAIMPVAFSLMASFLSAVTVIGVPADMYKFGAHLAYMNIGYVIGTVLCAYITLPVFFELQASTVYEYIERRFGKVARGVTCAAFVFQMILYMAVVLYAPSLALSAVTGMSIWVAVVSIGMVCTFYCTIGGMKAVLWTDMFQAILMYCGILTVLVKGFIDVGFKEVFTFSYEGGRLTPPGWEFDLTTRYTVWSVVFQGVFFSMSCFGANQVQVQRMLTVKNVERARMAIFANIPMNLVFHLLNCLVGLVIYAFYRNCDPLTSPERPISQADQLLPLYMISALSRYPGLPGLCICGVFSASLSTVSSAVNSLTAVTMQEIKSISPKKKALFAKIITLFYGTLCVVLTFVVASLGNVIQAALTILGILGAPVLGVFLMGMMTTRSNEGGAVLGLVTSVALSAWISFGATAYAPPPLALPVSVEGCVSSGFNTTLLEDANSLINSTVPFIEQIAESDVFVLYRISYLWYSPIGFVVAFVIGYIASIVIDCFRGQQKDVPDELLSPVLKYFMYQTKKIEDVKTKKPSVIEQLTNNNLKDLKVKDADNSKC